MKKLRVVFKESHAKNPQTIKKIDTIVQQYGWKVLHRVFLHETPVMVFYKATSNAKVGALSDVLYNMDSIQLYSFDERQMDGEARSVNLAHRLEEKAVGT